MVNVSAPFFKAFYNSIFTHILLILHYTLTCHDTEYLFITVPVNRWDILGNK